MNSVTLGCSWRWVLLMKTETAFEITVTISESHVDLSLWIRRDITFRISLVPDVKLLFEALLPPLEKLPLFLAPEQLFFQYMTEEQ